MKLSDLSNAEVLALYRNLRNQVKHENRGCGARSEMHFVKKRRPVFFLRMSWRGATCLPISDSQEEKTKGLHSRVAAQPALTVIEGGYREASADCEPSQ